MEKIEIHVTSDDWWQAIEKLAGISDRLKGDLKSVVSDAIHRIKGVRVIQTTAIDASIREAAERLTGNILIDHWCFRLMVWEPDDKEKHRHFFTLVECPKSGKLVDHFSGDAK